MGAFKVRYKYHFDGSDCIALFDLIDELHQSCAAVLS